MCDSCLLPCYVQTSALLLQMTCNKKGHASFYFEEQHNLSCYKIACNFMIYKHLFYSESENEEEEEDGSETDRSNICENDTKRSLTFKKNYRESSLSRMKCLTALRNRKQKEWNRDIKWLCEDVQVCFLLE